jgi:DNA-binding MarR family transcriptional regulator
VVQLSDLPFSIIFLFFLAVFLLFDLYAGSGKTTGKFRRLFGGRSEAEAPDAEPDREESLPDRHPEVQLTDLEGFVLMQLAQDRGKGMSRKQINASLHLSPAVFSATLESLSAKGMIRMALSPLLGIRCYLSENGRNYLMAEGYIPRILGHTDRPFNP